MGIVEQVLLTLCEQQFVDCVEVDSACYGELLDNGFAFAVNSLRVEDSCSFHWNQGYVPASTCTTRLAQGSVTGFTDVIIKSRFSAVWEK